MSNSDFFKIAESKMHKALDNFNGSLGKIRTGRAHIGILDHIKIDYYGTIVGLAQVANIGVLDARTLTVQPWEKRLQSLIEKAIRESDLGLNPVAQGDIIRIPMPLLTEERRRDLVKFAKSETEQAKIIIRNIRRDTNDHLKRSLKEKLISEDDERHIQENIQKLTDKFVNDLDKLIQVKEKEIMTV